MILHKRVFFVFFLTTIFTFSSVMGNIGFPGYCVKTNGDTLKGFFQNYIQGIYNPDKVNFTPSTSPVIIVLTPSEYSMFCVDEYEKYYSYKGQRLINPADSKSAQKDGGTDSANKFDTVTTFLRMFSEADGYDFLVLNGPFLFR